MKKSTDSNCFQLPFPLVRMISSHIPKSIKRIFLWVHLELVLVVLNNKKIVRFEEDKNKNFGIRKNKKEREAFRGSDQKKSNGMHNSCDTILYYNTLVFFYHILFM